MCVTSEPDDDIRSKVARLSRSHNQRPVPEAVPREWYSPVGHSLAVLLQHLTSQGQIDRSIYTRTHMHNWCSWMCMYIIYILDVCGWLHHRCVLHRTCQTYLVVIGTAFSQSNEKKRTCRLRLRDNLRQMEKLEPSACLLALLVCSPLVEKDAT